jgi:HAD superfamily hydrolase (TIGR01549 family)
MIKAVLFDLDETLILDEAVSETAFENALERLVEKYPSLERSAFRASLDGHKTRLWKASPYQGYFSRIGHSASEVLWAEYHSLDTLETRGLAQWAAGFRLEVWNTALLEQGITDPELASVLVENWKQDRASYPWYPEVNRLLNRLSISYQLGIITNGVPDLQRKKLRGAKLEEGFAAIAISGELDVGKPERGIFEWVCEILKVEPYECVMVGDNPERDVAGGIAAGMKTVWVDRGFKPRDPRFRADLEVKNMLEMLDWLEGLG